MDNIVIRIRDRRAMLMTQSYIVNGNTGYVIEFDFDSEWDEFAEKTARFVYCDKQGARHWIDVPITGNTCNTPKLERIDRVEVGVYAGNIRTSTSALIPCIWSITDSNGIIIMGYDAEYVDHITHNCVVFTDESINDFTAKYSATPQDIIYRDDEVRSVVLSIVPYLAVFSLISIAITIISACVLSKGIACNFRRLVMLGFEKEKLNQAYRSYICKSEVVSIVIALALSSIVFLFVDIKAIRIILVIWIPLIELITLFTATAIINRRLWRK